MKLAKNFFLIALLVYVCAAEKFSYDGYKLIRLFTDTDEKFKFINDLEGLDSNVYSKN